MAVECDQEIDNFKPVFKYFKNTSFEKISNEVIDFSKIDPNDDRIREVAINTNHAIESPIASDFRDIGQWKAFSVVGSDGLLVIPRVVKSESTAKWFDYLLNELPLSGSQHLRANIALPPSGAVDESNLRWISFGHHYNWDTKEYDECDQSPVPLLIEQLSQYMSRSLGFEGFVGEAGLINYYRHNSTLCPHSDHSEPNRTAPLFSLSLGSSAIFLIGSSSKSSSDRINAILVRDGDLLVMSGQCRQSYHAIPKIVSDKKRDSVGNVWRINLNVRQVY